MRFLPLLRRTNNHISQLIMKKIRKTWIALLGVMISALVLGSCRREEPIPVEKYGIPEIVPMYGVQPPSANE